MKIREFKFKPQPLLANAHTIRLEVVKETSVGDKVGTIKNFKYYPQFEQSILKSDYHKIVGIYDKLGNEIKISNFADLLKYDYVAEQKEKTLATLSNEDEKFIKQSNGAGRVFNRTSQGEAYFENKPFLFDKSRIWWMWNFTRYCYEKTDETSLLLSIREEMGVDTIDSKTRTEILQVLKEIGRKQYLSINKSDKNWIQFKDIIVNVRTNERKRANPNYFLTNPISYSLGKSTLTPNIDKLFKEWVTKEGVQDETYVKTLKQIIAYCLISDKFMQRIIALCGSGSNGKGTFIRLIQKILGRENFCASELRQLSQDRFATSSTYKKLACFMGEVSHNDLSDTARIKQMSGEDESSFQFKGKDAITDITTATFIIATNSLPSTPDKSIGFYRRWLIVDFPNQFPIKEGILEQISDEEIQNLCLQCVELLKEMYETCKFENEGTIEERASKFEERSNPIAIYLEQYCEDSPADMLSLKDFTDNFNQYLKIHRLRQLTARQIGNMLRNEGYDIGKRKLQDGDW